MCIDSKDVIILSENYQLPLPSGSFIVLSSSPIRPPTCEAKRYNRCLSNKITWRYLTTSCGSEGTALLVHDDWSTTNCKGYEQGGRGVIWETAQYLLERLKRNTKNLCYDSVCPSCNAESPGYTVITTLLLCSLKNTPSGVRFPGKMFYQQSSSIRRK